MKLQEALFTKIKETMANPKELAKIVQDLLNISSDAAYRRLRNETALSIDEAYKLSNHFKVSLSELETFRSNHVTFTKRPFIDSIETFEHFLQQSYEQLLQLVNDPNHLMLYTAKDVPVFYQYKFKELSAFKMYVWLRGLFEIEKLNDQYYDINSIPQHLLDLAHKQWEAYQKINAIEIWNDTTITSSLNQITYYYEAGLLATKEEALVLCDRMDDLLKIVYNQVRYGKRIFENGEPTNIDYKLYFNEVLIMNNNILSKINNRLIYNIPYATNNFLSTSNEELSNDMYNYILRQAKKSANLTDVSERDRNKFFLRQRNRIDEVRVRIENSTPFM